MAAGLRKGDRAEELEAGILGSPAEAITSCPAGFVVWLAWLSAKSNQASQQPIKQASKPATNQASKQASQPASNEASRQAMKQAKTRQMHHVS